MTWHVWRRWELGEDAHARLSGRVVVPFSDAFSPLSAQTCDDFAATLVAGGRARQRPRGEQVHGRERGRTDPAQISRGPRPDRPSAADDLLLDLAIVAEDLKPVRLVVANGPGVHRPVIAHRRASPTVYRRPAPDLHPPLNPRPAPAAYGRRSA